MRRVHSPPSYPILFVAAAELDGVAAPSDDKEAARAALARAASRGFLYCEAVFVERGNLLSYDGLSEKAHPTNGSLNWGRGQEISERHFFRDGKLVPDPDYRADFTPEAEWEHAGLRCYSWYVKDMGHRCGYVVIPAEHPWHGKSYDQCLLTPPCEESWCDHSVASAVSVHGGITWADTNARGEWVIGFDCAHSGDRPSPEFSAERERRYGYDSFTSRSGHYWTLDDVRDEINRLAAQVAVVATGALLEAPEA